MVRRWGVLVVVVVAAGVVGAAPAVAQDTEGSDVAASTVRIQARLVESGKVEFGLQLDGDRVWLPRQRLFPYPTAEIGNWLFASPYTLSDGTVVRIQARLAESGKVEFGLQLDGDRVWLPRQRLFPYPTAEIGNWLFASPYTATASESEATPPTEPDEATEDGNSGTEITVKEVNQAWADEFQRLGELMSYCNYDYSSEQCDNGNDATTEEIIQGHKNLYGCDFSLRSGRCSGLTLEETWDIGITFLCGDSDNWIVANWQCRRIN